MNIFNFNELIQNRNSAAKDFKDFNFLKKEITSLLLEHLDYAKGDFPLALDIGSHNGEVAEVLKNHNKVKTIVSLDFAKNMLLYDTTSNIKLLSSLHNMPFRKNTFNLVTSVFSLHSVNKFTSILQEIWRILQKDGLLLLSIPCFGNLSALNNAFLETELEISSQFTNHIHPFLDVKTIANLVSSAGFVSVISNKEDITIMYKSLKGILKDFRGMGENNVLLNKSKSILDLNFWNKFKEIMEKQKNSENNHYPVKIEFCNLLAWKN